MMLIIYLPKRIRYSAYMKLIRYFITLIPVLFCLPSMAAEPIQHQLELVLNPAKGQLQVEDKIRFPEPDLKQIYAFSLNKKLNIIDSEPTVERLPSNTSFARYQLTGPLNKIEFILRYQGVLDQDNPGLGTISSKGVFLSRSSFWFPVFDDELVSFSLTINLPERWYAISQGEGRIDAGTIIWNEAQPQDDIYLVAGEYFIQRKNIKGIELQFYSRTEETELAQGYFQASEKYLKLYQEMLGPYPYKKFAVVENFWETGYGMPSFTLLGPRVIRFPFILYSSLPHELLHNWWGNGVYVDYSRGNWAEGLTAYLADHLIQEQRGQGANYRRSLLQKYSDHINSNRDFSLSTFSSRHDTASEAVGYGKSALLFHMLRQKLGDKVFIQALRDFYRNNRFKTASFDDLKTSFSAVSQQNLDIEFEQWLQRTGAPQMELISAKNITNNSSTHIEFELQQTQPGKVYRLNIPIAVQLKNQPGTLQTRVTMTEKKQRFTVEVPAEAARLLIDPEFDIFRRLQSEEIPSALSQGFGSEKVLLVLPRSNSGELTKNYQQLAQSWQSRFAGDWRILFDDEIDQLPKDHSIWLLGWDNRFRQAFIEALNQPGTFTEDNVIRLQQKTFSRNDHSLLLTARLPQNPEHTLLWLATGNPMAIAGLARKLPHYRKYSYLVFEGDAPNNVLKGQWPVWDSPMSLMLSEDQDTVPLRLSPRKSLDNAVTE